MNEKPYRVLVGVDFSELADRALQEALSLASKRENAEVHVLSILPAPNTDPRYAISVYAGLDANAALETATQRLQEHVAVQLQKFAAAQSAPVPALRVVYHVNIDTAAHGIVQLASEIEAGLIVIGTHNRKGTERLLLGSVAEATVRRAPCPVLVIPARQQAEEVPENERIAPPCPECVKARQASAGRELWCAQHRERHGRRHTFHQSDRSGIEANFPLTFR